MALINPTGATAAWNASTAIDRIIYAGSQIWTKPAPAATSIFSLTAAQAGKNGFTASDATATGIALDRTSTGRSWISWAVNWPVGSRVVFDWVTANPATGVWCSLDDALGLSTPTHDLMRNVSGGGGHVDFTIPAAGYAYFGFSVSNGQATGLLTISKFAVYAP